MVLAGKVSGIEEKRDPGGADKEDETGHHRDVEPDRFPTEPSVAEGEPDGTQSDDVGGVEPVGESRTPPETQSGADDGDEEAEGEEEVGDLNHRVWLCGGFPPG